LRAGPIGAGSFGREPTIANATAAIRSKAIASAIQRQGSAGAMTGWRATSTMGIHLPGKVQAGRCRFRLVTVRTSSR
jgi:hypothetical protein